MRDVSTIIKQLNRVDHSLEISKIDEEKTSITEKIDKLKLEKDKLEIEKNDLNKKILDDHKTIQAISSKTINEDSLRQEIVDLEKNLSLLVSKEALIVMQIKTVKDDLTRHNDKLESIDITQLENSIEQLKVLNQDKFIVDMELNNTNIHISNQKDKLEKLQKLEYDENCSYCMNNIFVKDAISTKKSHEDLLIKKQSLDLSLESLEEKIKSLGDVKEVKNKYDSIKAAINEKEKQFLKLQSDLSKIETDQNLTKQKIKDKELELEAYRKEKKKIEKNTEIQIRIDAYEKELAIVENKLKIISQDLTEALLTDNSLTVKKDSYTKDLIELVKLQSKYEIYKYYTEAVHRDGVPHQLISDTIPQLQDEINSILQQLVDFQIVLHPDDKNINTYIAYDNDRYWPIELTSGMEKFISSLAIRSSLINVSSLPRPNFIAIDEGFGALDQNNLSSIVSYFDHLKNQFKFIMIISHIDSMKDVVDHQIEISKIMGKSNIQHTS
jgi:exonuclease SbcC